MPKFKCVNKECKNFDISITVFKVSWIFNKALNKLVIRNKIFCSECNSELEYVVEAGDIKCNLLKFDSLSSEDKKKIMMKRNREHYEKYDKARVEDMRKKIIEDNKKQFKL